MKDLKTIFIKIEESLKETSYLDEKQFIKRFGEFKNFENRVISDNQIYSLLVMIVFYSGFKAETVDKKKKTIEKHFPNYRIVSNYDDAKIQLICNDSLMISNLRKIKACINNAKTFEHIIKEFGSFNNYLEKFQANKSFENLMLLKEELEYKFDYLGGITVYHFLTDLGFNVLKPDRVIQRIYKRLGLIDDEKQLLKSVIIGRKFSEATGNPIRYIDIIMVKYGQQGRSDELGIVDGICLKINPQCDKCGVFEYCRFENEK